MPIDGPHKFNPALEPHTIVREQGPHEGPHAPAGSPHEAPRAPPPPAPGDVFTYSPSPASSLPESRASAHIAEPENKYTQLLQNPIENIRNKIIQDKIPPERKSTMSAILQLTNAEAGASADPAKLKDALEILKNATTNPTEKRFIEDCIKGEHPLDALGSYVNNTVNSQLGEKRQKTISDITNIETNSKSSRSTIAQLKELLTNKETPDSENDLIKETIKHYQAKELFPAMMTGLAAAQLVHRDPVYEILNKPWLSAEEKRSSLALKQKQVEGIVAIATNDNRNTLTPEELKKVGTLEADIARLRVSADVSDAASKEVHEKEKGLGSSVEDVAQAKKGLESLLQKDLTPSDKKYVSERLELWGAIGDLAELNENLEDSGTIESNLVILRQKRDSSTNPEVITLYNKTIQVDEARLRVVETLQNAAAQYIDNPRLLGLAPNFTYMAKKEAARGQEVKPSLEMKTQLEERLKDAAVTPASKRFQEKMAKRLGQSPELNRRLTFESSLLSTLGRENTQFVEKRDSWERQIGSYEALHEQGAELVRGHEGALADAKTSLETTKDVISKLQKQVEENQAEPTEQMSADISKLRDTASEKQDKIDKLTKELEDLKGIADAKQYSKWANFYERQKYGMMMNEVTSQTYNASRKIRELQAEKATLEKAGPLPHGITLETKAERLTEITAELAKLDEKRKQLGEAFDTGMRYMRQFDIDGVTNYPDRRYMSRMGASLKDILGFSGDYAKPTKEYYMENVLQRDGYSSVESMQLLLEKINGQSGVVNGLKALAGQLLELGKTGYKNPGLSEALAGDIGHIIAQLSGLGTTANTLGRLYNERRVRDVLVGTLTEGPGAENFGQNIPPELIGLIRALQQAPYLIGAVKGAAGTGGTLAEGGHLLAAGIPVLSQILGAGGGVLQTAIEKRVAQSVPRDAEKYLAAVQTLVKTGDLKAAAKDFYSRKLIQSAGGTVRELYEYGFMDKLKDIVTLKSFRRWWTNASGTERAARIFGQAVVPLAMVAGAVGIAIATGGLALIPIIIAAASGAGTALGVSLGAKYFGDAAWRGTDDKIFKERNNDRLEAEFAKNKDAEDSFNAYASRLGLSDQAKQQFKQETFDELSKHMLEAKKASKNPSLADIKNVMDKATETRQTEMAQRLTAELDSLGVEKGAGSLRAEQTPEQAIADLESVLFSGKDGVLPPKWSDGFTGHLAANEKQPLKAATR